MVFVEHRGEQVRPAAEGAQARAADDKAQVGDILFDEREAAVTAVEEEDFNEFSQGRSLRGHEAPMQFEADEVALPGGRTIPSVEVVFTSGEKYIMSAEGLVAAEAGMPQIVVGSELIDEDAALDVASGFLGTGEHGFIEGEAGQGERGEGQ